ncbi:MAG: hypothetical protein EHM64_05785 [Ignavibacteriae bacterium]|nr:MAG: hypothetical protein EHM64_05785 [Ignavibacteriota bacterium]
MYPTNKITVAAFLALLLGVLLCAFVGCDSLTPTDFKSQNYTPDDIDLKAGTMLLRDTVNDLQGNTYAYQYGALDSSGVPSTTIAASYRVLPVTWGSVNARTLSSYRTTADTTDTQIILSQFDVITTTLPTINKDSLILVNYPVGQTVSYAVLKSAQAQDVYIYSGLQYYAGNANEYVTIDVLKRDNSSVASSTQLPAKSVYGAIEKIQVQSATRILPAINARYAVHLDQGGVYLVRFTLSNVSISNPQTRPTVPAVPSVSNQFKVVILSHE